MNRWLKYVTCFVVTCCTFSARTQAPFALDGGFVTEITESFTQSYVTSVLVLEDGNTVISGAIKFPGDIYDRAGALLNSDGSRNLDFAEVAYMGGKIIKWNDQMYCGNGIGLRRLWLNGLNDQSFNMVNAPYFSPLQGGDYHVFPDGRVVISGLHQLSDSVRGFVGMYNFIWFTNEGYLDTTRTHRKGNGVNYYFNELLDGKFLCSGTGSIYDEQPVHKIFRVHPDGSLDPTFQSDVFWGEAFSYLPLGDGRIYAGGLMRRNAAPDDTLRLVRFMPDGSLDPSFTIPQFGLGEPYTTSLGSLVSSIFLFDEQGHIIVTGRFQTVNGQPRRGICMLDSSGALLNVFHDHGCFPYEFNSYVYGSIAGITPYGEDHYLVWGGYQGYSDGQTTDMDQRYVTRLHAGELNISVAQNSASEERGHRVYPNPSSGTVTITFDPGVTDGEEARILISDGLGRSLSTVLLKDRSGQVVIDIDQYGPGVYVVEMIIDQRRAFTEKLIVH